MSAVAESSEVARYLDHISPSGISTYIRCPNQFREKYILKQKERVGWKALLGSGDSKAYELYMLARIAGTRLSLDDVSDAFRDTVIDAQDEYDLDDKKLGVQTASSIIDAGLPSVQAYYPVAEALPDPIGAEGWIRIENESLPVPLIGRTDFEFPQMVVERKNTDKAMIKPSWRFQARVYAAALQKPVHWHLSTRTKVPAVWTPDTVDAEKRDQWETPWSEAAASRTIRRVGQILGEIDAALLMWGPEQTWPTHGLDHEWACGLCSFKSRCPAWS